MKRIVMVIGFLGMFMMLFGMPAAFAGSTTHEDYGWIPLQFNYPSTCTGEDISVTGIFHLQTTFIDDASGGAHGEASSVFRGTAVGSISENGYKFMEAFACVENIPTSGSYSLACPVNGRFISLDKDEPNVFYHGNFIIVFDANGNPRVDTIFYEETCR
jgi:hypothetical protein